MVDIADTSQGLSQLPVGVEIIGFVPGANGTADAIVRIPPSLLGTGGSSSNGGLTTAEVNQLIATALGTDVEEWARTDGGEVLIPAEKLANAPGLTDEQTAQIAKIAGIETGQTRTEIERSRRYNKRLPTDATRRRKSSIVI